MAANIDYDCQETVQQVSADRPFYFIELVQHVGLRPVFEYLDEAGARVARVADKKQARIVFHALAATADSDWAGR